MTGLFPHASPRPLPYEARAVLAGGGTLPNTARPLLKVGVDMSGKEAPRVLLISTPKLDDRATFDKAVAVGQNVFGDQIGANVDVLHDFDRFGSHDELGEKIDNADVIYISGGNTRRAIAEWKKHGIDAFLSDALAKGTVMTGISAGALSWFDAAHSDSDSYEVAEGKPWAYRLMKGLGHIGALATAHFNSTSTPDGRPRSAHFADALAGLAQASGRTEHGLGIDNEAALVVNNGLVNTLQAREDARMHHVSVDPDGRRAFHVLRTPTTLVSLDFASADKLPEGVSWENFYSQLRNDS